MRRTVRTTKHLTILFDAMADHPTPTVATSWCQRLDGALEGIKRVCAIVHFDRERLVVVIAACFTFRHGCILQNRTRYTPERTDLIRHWARQPCRDVQTECRPKRARATEWKITLLVVERIAGRDVAMRWGAPESGPKLGG